MNGINQTALLKALGNLFDTKVQSADYTVEELQGGTLGDVVKLSGEAQTATGTKPFTIVLKSQKKWERAGDPGSWRREYDLYQSNFGNIFTDTLRRPQCYLAEMNGDKIELWMEYVDGKSGDKLDLKALEFAAAEWGRFQGRLYNQSEKLTGIRCMSEPDWLRKNFEQWHKRTYSYEFLISEKCRLPGFLKQLLKDRKIRLYDGKSFEYGCLRSEACDIPAHLKRMLMELDEHKDAVFKRIKELPVVLCHRDFWTENIFVSNGKIRLIDWDCAGWGFLGEDIASLVYDEIETENLYDYFQTLVPAYVHAVSEYINIPQNINRYITDLILIVFSYRAVQEYMFTQDPEVKKEQIKRLQAVYELRELDENY